MMQAVSCSGLTVYFDRNSGIRSSGTTVHFRKNKQKQEERKKRDRRLYEKGGVFESIFTESKDFTKDEFYQLITFPNIKELVNQKIKKIIESREQSENQNTEMKEEETDIEE